MTMVWTVRQTILILQQRKNDNNNNNSNNNGIDCEDTGMRAKSEHTRSQIPYTFLRAEWRSFY